MFDTLNCQYALNRELAIYQFIIPIHTEEDVKTNFVNWSNIPISDLVTNLIILRNVMINIAQTYWVADCGHAKLFNLTAMLVSLEHRPANMFGEGLGILERYKDLATQWCIRPPYLRIGDRAFNSKQLDKWARDSLYPVLQGKFACQ